MELAADRLTVAAGAVRFPGCGLARLEIERAIRTVNAKCA